MPASDPAYPWIDPGLKGEVPDVSYRGLTKLEWMAGMAIAMGEGVWDGSNNNGGCATKCVNLAAAILTECERREKADA